MIKELVVVHVVSGVVDAVRIVRKVDHEESENEHYERAIGEAREIVEKATSSGFNADDDYCGIFAVDAKGESHEVWSYGSGEEEPD